MHEWTTLATRQEDVVFEDDEAMACDFSLDDFGVATSTPDDQFVFNQFFM
jgi:hypothetical protein